MSRKMELESALLLLSVVELPFVRLAWFEDAYSRPVAGVTVYAVTCHNVRYGYQSWCHNDSSHPSDWAGPVTSPWHRSDVDAWECFESNHPGLVAAINAAEEWRSVENG